MAERGMDEVDGGAANGWRELRRPADRRSLEVEGGRRGCAVKLWTRSLNTVLPQGRIDKAETCYKKAATLLTGRPDQYLHRSNPKSWTVALDMPPIARQFRMDNSKAAICIGGFLVAVSLQDFRPNSAAVAPSRLSIVQS